MNWAKTTGRRDEEHLGLVIGCDLYYRFYGRYNNWFISDTKTILKQNKKICALSNFQGDPVPYLIFHQQLVILRTVSLSPLQLVFGTLCLLLQQEDVFTSVSNKRGINFYHLCYINGLVQDCSNSSALAMELLQSCSKPSIYPFIMSDYDINQVMIVTSFYAWSARWLHPACLSLKKSIYGQNWVKYGCTET